MNINIRDKKHKVKNFFIKKVIFFQKNNKPKITRKTKNNNNENKPNNKATEIVPLQEQYIKNTALNKRFPDFNY